MSLMHTPSSGTPTIVDTAHDQQSDVEAGTNQRGPAGSVKSGTTQKKEANDLYLVTLDPTEDPKSLSLRRKWLAVIIISSAATCVTCASSVASFTQKPMQAEWHVSSPLTILGISLFVAGLGIGPLLLAPLSEFYGRNAVYWYSYGMFLLLNFPVAFAPNIVVYLIFRFLSGFSGAAFLSVAGGSVSDLFCNETVGLPMAVYTASPMIGPVLGPLISGFINQHLDWRWTYHLIIIWSAVELALLILLVPETYEPALRTIKARKLRQTTRDEKYYSPLERSNKGLLNTIIISCYRPFQIIYFEPMALAVDVWASLILGVLYLTFEAFPTRVFGASRGFNTQMSGLSFLGIGIGQLLAILSQPFWVNLYAKEREQLGGKEPQPEARLKIGMAGAVLVPVGLFWFAFTTPPHIHWVVPMLATIPFGAGVVYAFIAIFTFLVHAYRPYAASAMAGNSFMRSAFAAAFPLFSGAMYSKLGTVGATALLAGLTVLMVPLPFVFYRMGPRLRKNSHFAL